MQLRLIDMVALINKLRTKEITVDMLATPNDFIVQYLGLNYEVGIANAKDVELFKETIPSAMCVETDLVPVQEWIVLFNGIKRIVLVAKKNTISFYTYSYTEGEHEQTEDTNA